eukprot:TRINITY_DN1914_c0_g2_i2.p1 TRINITY_DN1914_c0_g2~~TRINITY_DN1914_c0_g2_i2.p1  ORF type:complete len:197 (+),score=53.53 TRINITY_DN1914_c0_g2_i2:106-696(+)
MLRLRLFDVLERFSANVVGPFYRRLGQSLTESGVRIQGDPNADERLVPSTRCRPYKTSTPQLGRADFVAPNAAVIGNVRVGEKSSLWYGTTVRGDLANVEIGNNVIVQDLATLYPAVDAQTRKGIKIGNNVFIGPNSVLEGCTVEANAFVGMGSSVRSGSKVESFAVVAAGAVIPENTTVPSNQVLRSILNSSNLR